MNLSTVLRNTSSNRIYSNMSPSVSHSQLTLFVVVYSRHQGKVKSIATDLAGRKQ